MSSETTFTKRDHALLIGDGWLLTAGTMSVAMALMFGFMAIPGVEKGPSLVSALVSNALLLAGGVGGVVLTWLLNGRRITVLTALGGFAGAGAGGVLVPIAAGLSFLLGFPMKLFTDWEFAGPVAMLALLSLGLIALTAWLLVDAIRDLAPSRRTHARLDVARIAAAVAFASVAAVCAYLIFAQPGPEQGEAVIWVMAGGAVGAGVIAGADLVTVIAKGPKRAAPEGE
ncbi:MAG: hypothetical protein Q7W16_02320 [Coriobacteriia bacterium]|nr:hypothetical protein [Coriobacteriia bacterium]